MEVKISNNNKMWYYRVKKEDESLGIQKFLKRFNFMEEDFYELNKQFTALKAGKVLLMPASSKYHHIVGPLETYESIAKSYNCSVEYLKTINKSNMLFIGQKIFL